jgi:cell division protein FtsB
MWGNTNLALKLKKLAVVSVFGGLVLYFSFFAIAGERGLITLNRLENQVAEAQEKLTSLQTEHDALQRQVSRLSPESLDTDLLEERARIVLNFSRPTDLVMLQSPQAQPTAVARVSTAALQ